jgi:murein DD-endopeptidase MepM/ murein hydrolase activator NlpD
MQEFDPRRPAFRMAPRLMVGLAGGLALLLGWRLTGAEAHLPSQGFQAQDAARLSALQTRAFAEAGAQPGLGLADSIDIQVQSGETMERAIRRAGVAPEEAKAASDALSGAFDPNHLKAGLSFKASVARDLSDPGLAKLVGLSLRLSPSSVVTLSRAYDGSLKLRQLNEKILDETTVAQGDIEGSLYETAAEQGATDALTTQAAKLFSHKIDFTRDIHQGDTFKMVFTRKVTESGNTVEAGDLLYAEVDAGKATNGALRFYHFTQAGASDTEYFDETGRNTKGFLLATPVAVVRVTSSFGMRLHPILGYTRMHQGIDFGGATGTPIYAAGDGVVTRAGWAGGYGNLVQIRHDGAWSTGYGHMSRFAAGIRPGVHVHQGEAIGYIGATGEATGPHLHYEVMENGEKINPHDAKVPAGGTQLTGRELTAFKAEKARIDGMIQKSLTTGQTRIATEAPSVEVKVAAGGLRPAQLVR